MAEKTNIAPRTRERNPNWHGGVSVSSNGYRLVKKADSPNAHKTGYVYEHRLVAAKKVGRPLLKTEIVHHIDGNKLNNDPENLVIEPSRAHHHLEHRRVNKMLRLPNEENVLTECQCGCGSIFHKYDEQGRPRKFMPSHNLHGRIKHGYQYKRERVCNGR